MKKIYFLLPFFLPLKIICQQQPVSSGGDAATSDGNVSYSVGQVACQYASGISGSINEGVQQAFEITSTLGTDISDIKLEIQIFPNPVTDILNLKISNLSTNKMQYRLYDLSGKLLKSETIKMAETQISLQEFASSVYQLHIINEAKIIKIFKIIKK